MNLPDLITQVSGQASAIAALWRTYLEVLDKT